MKATKIAFAVASIFATSHVSAATVVTDLSSATNTFYISGATAQTPSLAKSLEAFCSVTMKTYVDTVDGATSLLYRCDSANNATSGLTGSFNVFKLENGSSNGVKVVASGTSVNNASTGWLNATAVNVGAVPGSYNTAIVSGAIDGTAAISGSVSAIPQLGMTDVSVNTWKARGVTGIPASGYTSTYVGGQAFGVAVSDKLYKLLQEDQGLSTSATADQYVNQPSLSKAQYAALTSSYNGIWQKLVPNLAFNAVRAATLPSTLELARRSDTSGTQASSEAFFLNYPCVATGKMTGSLTAIGAQSPVVADTSLAALSGGVTMTVNLKSTTGQVKSALATDNAYAIGVLSLENLQPTNTEDNFTDWKYVKIDGVSPNWKADGTYDDTQKLSTVTGKYTFAYEMELVSKNSIVSGNAPLAAFRSALLTDLANGGNLTTSTGVFASAEKATVGNRTLANAPHTSRYSRLSNPCLPHKMVWY